MKNMEVLREQWMWNREARSIWLWAFIASGVFLAAILYQRESLAGEEGDMAERLANIGRVQGPAIVIMEETELVLVPLVAAKTTP